MDKRLKRRIGRLVQLHYETSPERLARRFGITARYVRLIWASTEGWEMALVAEALEELQSRKGS